MAQPKSLSRNILNSFLQMLTGSGISFVSSMISGYFFALILGPAVYGIWQTAKVFSSYGSFTSLGIPFVMRRDFVTLRSEGKFTEAEKLAHVAISYSMIIQPLLALIFIIISIFSNGELAFRLSLLLIGILCLTQFPSSIGQILHKGINDYKTIGIGEIISGIGTLSIIPFVYLYGFNALIIGFFMLSVVLSAYFYVKKPVSYKWVWDFPVLRKMIFTGFPLFLVSIISTVFISIDRLLIAGLIDFKNVGLYSLSSFIAQPITLILSSFSIIIFTHLNEKYGKSKEPHVLEKQTYIPQKIFSYILPPFIGIAVVALPVFTDLLLPQYKDGIEAAQINIFAILFLKLATFSTNGLFILDKHKYAAVSFFIAGCIKTTGSYLGLRAGYGIEVVAVFTFIAYFFYNALMLYFINKSLGNKPVIFFRRLLESYICPLTVLAFCLLYVTYNSEVYSFMGIYDQWIRMLIGIILICLVCAGFLKYTYKQIRLILYK